MGKASFMQASFLGGEWSPQMQGRIDNPEYRSALNLCFNVIPTEEGAATRRSGTRLGGPTRSGAFAVLREFNVDASQPFDVELTAGHLRLWKAGAGIVTDSLTAITGISSATPAVFTAISHGLATGDQVVFDLGSATSYAGISQVLGRQLTVTAPTLDTFTAVDALTGAAVDGTLITFSDLTTLTVSQIFDTGTPYGADDLQEVRLVQTGSQALLLHADYPPQVLTIVTDGAGEIQSATLAGAVFRDGPWLDVLTDGTTLTPTSASDNPTLYTASSAVNINGGNGFTSDDIGRQFRIFSEPALWDSIQAYSSGDKVTDAGTYWTAVAGSTNVEPQNDNGTHWVITPSAAKWSWGVITDIQAMTSFHGTLVDQVTYPDNIASGPILYDDIPARAWQLGAYNGQVGFPSCGAYYQGRLWLGGAVKNRFDACVSNDYGNNGYINMAPTGADGTVADDNGITGTLNAKEIENFLWMSPDEQGVLAGTQSGEWMIASSSNGEPITATSIQAREMTHYGSVDQQAIKVGRATIFIERDGRKIYEYMANYFTQKFVAENLSLKAKHLTTSGIAELAYMRELTPVIWARRNDGTLIGCTYKHDDPIKPMEFAGWHQHQLGTGRKVISIQSGPANHGETDTLAMVTQDPVTTYCYVEFLQTVWDSATDTPLTAWYVDGGAQAVAAERITLNGTEIIRIYGLWYAAGETITIWGAGLDLGDVVVSAQGTIDLPVNAGTSLFTDDLLAQITAGGCTSLATDVAASYIVSAEENYDPIRVNLLSTGAIPAFCFCNKQYIGTSYDRVNRNIMYSMMLTGNPYNGDVTPTNDGQDGSVVADGNQTQRTLWSGFGATPPGNILNFDYDFTYNTMVKNLDTGKVAIHTPFSPTEIVPAGFGAGGIVGFSIDRDASYSGTAFGEYEAVTLSGGTGFGATGKALYNIQGVLTSFILWNIGYGYTVGDQLTIVGRQEVALDSHDTLIVAEINSGSDGQNWSRSIYGASIDGGQ